MTDYSKLMLSVCDKTPAPPYYNELWTVTQAELELFAQAVRAAALEEAAVEFEWRGHFSGVDIAEHLRKMKESRNV